MANLDGYPALKRLTQALDEHLSRAYPEFFGPDPVRPILPVKSRKIIHDSQWGTNTYSWPELVLLDSPVLQRLRWIKQTGLAEFVYPGATHSRLEHSLGVVTIASRIFDALEINSPERFKAAASELKQADEGAFRARLRQELRLAALLHDAGHSLFSHASEPVYGNLTPVREASGELTEFVGQTKGAGEVLSFCLAHTNALQTLLQRARDNMVGASGLPVPDLQRAALAIVGRSSHPCLQFLGDIVSSALDADKLDYLLRDAQAAGLPMRYDVDRYLHEIKVVQKRLADGEGKLKRFYQVVGEGVEPRLQPADSNGFEYYHANRAVLPSKAINAIEQVFIAKFMLFGYIYHHPKVRAAEGMLARMLESMVSSWQALGLNDCDALCRFMTMEDWAVGSTDLPEYRGCGTHCREYSVRIKSRLISREVFRLSGAIVPRPFRAQLQVFLASLQGADGRDRVIQLERQIGQELLAIDPDFAESPTQALLRAGTWVDVPKPPKFEGIADVVDSGREEGPEIPGMLPLNHWSDAYMHYRYFVRIFAFSEHCEMVRRAAEAALRAELAICEPAFFEAIARTRS